MKIAIATPILYDATSPFNHLFKDIIGAFLDDGNEIVRLVAVTVDVSEDYKYGFVSNNIKYKTYIRQCSSHGNIFSRYINDNVTAMREAIGILMEKDIDVLFEDVCYSSIWPVIAAKLKGVKVVAMLQDVWPDNAVQSNLISESSLIYKFFEVWQRIIYKKADRIICISDDMKDFIVSKGVDSTKIEVIYNWGYSDEIVDIAWEDNLFVKKYNLDKNKFYAVYAGNIGKMQNVEIVVKAAKELQDNKDIHFLIIGDGARREEIANMVKEYKLENVTMLPLQPSELAVHIYSAAGVNLIPLVKGGTKTAMPSKTGVVLSCGRAVIFTYGKGSTFAKYVENFKGGYSVEPDDYNELAKLILKIRDIGIDKNDNYILFKKFFTRNSNMKAYVKIFESL